MVAKLEVEVLKTKIVLASFVEHALNQTKPKKTMTLLHTFDSFQIIFAS